MMSDSRPKGSYQSAWSGSAATIIAAIIVGSATIVAAAMSNKPQAPKPSNVNPAPEYRLIPGTW